MIDSKAAVKVVEAIGSQITEAVATVAEKVGPVAQHVYAVMVRQMWLDSLMGMLVCGAFGLTFWVLAVLCWRTKKEPVDGDTYFGVSILFLLGLLIFSLGLYCNVPSLLNPEYAAIERLTRMVK